MKNILALIAALALFSCGEDRVASLDPKIPPAMVTECHGATTGCVDTDLAEIVDEFNADWGDVNEYNVVFGAFSAAATDTGGACYLLHGVYIAEDLRDAPRDVLRLIVYHELGHCALVLPHINDMDGPWPVSMMSQFADIYRDHIVANWDEYVQNLFTSK